MTTKKMVLKVRKETAQEMQRIMDQPDSTVKKDETEFDREVHFDDGNYMVIQVIGSTQPDVEPAWGQGVLFDANGNELACTDACETFLGDYQINFDSVDYVVEVKMATIFKTTITITVLSEENEFSEENLDKIQDSDSILRFVDYEITDGQFLGKVDITKIEETVDILEESKNLGNDGEFFDFLDE